MGLPSNGDGENTGTSTAVLACVLFGKEEAETTESALAGSDLKRRKSTIMVLYRSSS